MIFQGFFIIILILLINGVPAGFRLSKGIQGYSGQCYDGVPGCSGSVSRVLWGCCGNVPGCLGTLITMPE